VGFKLTILDIALPKALSVSYQGCHLFKLSCAFLLHEMTYSLPGGIINPFYMLE